MYRDLLLQYYVTLGPDLISFCMQNMTLEWQTKPNRFSMICLEVINLNPF